MKPLFRFVAVLLLAVAPAAAKPAATAAKPATSAPAAPAPGATAPAPVATVPAPTASDGAGGVPALEAAHAEGIGPPEDHSAQPKDDTVCCCCKCKHGDTLENAHAQGIGAPAVAEGVGNFLVTRAEKEVTAYATVELFSKLCDSDVRSILPNTCALLAAQGDGEGPVGLGVLQRAALKDLEAAPANAFLALASEYKDDRNAMNAICTADAAYGFTRAVLDGQKIDATLMKTAQEYATLAATSCNFLWAKLNWGLAVGVAAQNLQRDMAKLRAQGLDEPTRRQLRSQVVTDAAAVFLLVDSGADKDLVDEIVAVAVPAWNHEWLEAVAALASAETLGHRVLCNTGPDEDCPAFKKVSVVLGLVGDIAAAKDSSGVQATLDRVAEPIGSWRRKFESPTITINGYAGLKGGYEGVEGAPPSGTDLAPILALGLEFPALPHSWGYGHLRLFAQVIDVGNVASVHFAGKDDPNLTKVKANPEVDFQQLLAPGGYLVWAPARAPFALGVGGDWVPNLRKTDDGGLHSVWHLNGMISVDVPVLELYHR